MTVPRREEQKAIVGVDPRLTRRHYACPGCGCGVLLGPRVLDPDGIAIEWPQPICTRDGLQMQWMPVENTHRHAATGVTYP